MKELKETHTQGHVSVENNDLILAMELANADFGIQIAKDGRVWICINGIAFIRFRPRISRRTSGT